MTLSVVPPAVPDRKAAIKERLKATARPDGMLQCPRCGCRDMVTETSGVTIQDGKKKGGTVTAKDVCANCYKGGILQPMAPQLKAVD